MKDTVQAIALGSVRYGDTSLIAACYTRQYGLQSYMLKGILSAKRNKKLSKSFFEPLSLLEFEAKRNQDHKLGYLQQVHLLYPYSTIPFDLRKKAVVFFLAEIIHQVLKEEQQEANTSLFDFIQKRMLWLDENDSIGLFHLKTILDLTLFIGFEPNMSDRDAPFFDLESGCMCRYKPKANFIEGRLKNLWVGILGMKFDLILEIKVSKEEKAALLDYAIKYFKLHLQQFKSPKSKEILNEIFKVS
jgi:DNA repair protein RecO (recombination protein O)